MSLKCLAARRALLLGEEAAASVREHLERCETCRRFEAGERAAAAAVRTRSRRAPAPQALRERLVAALEEERHRTARGRRRWLRSAGLLAAAALLAVAAFMLLAPPDGTAEARRTVAALAADHMEYATGGAMELASSSPAEVADWLRARTRLAVTVPVPPEATVLGARRCRLRGRPAALVSYRLPGSGRDAGGSAASLFVFQSAGEEWSSMETLAARRPKRICRAHDRGLNVLVWEDRGLTYAFVTDISEPELSRLAEHL
jgi:anti-sigma factor RsiW